MKNQLLMIFLLACTFNSWGYERESLPNLVTPSELKAKQMQISIVHRFLGKVNDDPIDNILGMDNGAKAALGLRAGLGRGIELKLLRGMSYTKDALLGLAYTRIIAGVSAQFECHYLSVRDNFNTDDRTGSLFGLLSLQTDPIAKRFSFIGNLGYDQDAEYTAAAIGLDVTVSSKVRIHGETGLTTLDSNDLEKNSFALGIKILTYGHHFLFTAGNSHAIHSQKFMHGAASHDLFFGFSIHRILDLD